MNAIGYIRISAKSKSGDEVSLARQTAQIEAYAKTNDLTLTAIESDQAQSGGRWTRKGFQRVLEAVANGSAGVVVTYALDRLSRDGQHVRRARNLITKNGGRLVCLSDNLDLAPRDLPREKRRVYADGELLFSTTAFVGDIYRQIISKKMVDFWAHRRSQGWKTAGTTPYGYDLAADQKTLVKNSHEQEGIALMKDLRAKGSSYRRIGKLLERQGFKTKKGNTRWSPYTIACVLANHK